VFVDLFFFLVYVTLVLDGRNVNQFKNLNNNLKTLISGTGAGTPGQSLVW